ncbi:LOW QUALITY PROTEIN: hypothetical protein KUTeg_011789 [Tegillarca granosa]|uniref:Mannosyltransferase n=1 Tax=Tegillarca granosa TaxID=220873 RepID=A0ABQ9EXN6_TEGGR|nr:LOW QUALITY PROTEIN: hypothetical protein KUTeg_011789 [Tegillarca granosa]
MYAVTPHSSDFVESSSLNDLQNDAATLKGKKQSMAYENNLEKNIKNLLDKDPFNGEIIKDLEKVKKDLEKIGNKKVEGSMIHSRARLFSFDFFSVGPDVIERVKNIIYNPFWIETIENWIEFSNEYNLKGTFLDFIGFLLVTSFPKHWIEAIKIVCQVIERPYPVLPTQIVITGFTAFKLLLSARLCAALWNIVGDCDETYNYWEPMHYLLFKKGFQTWEYSPVYAIRSYAYLWVHALPLSLYNNFFVANKILLFYYLRCVLAFCCALSEIYFYKGVCKHFGANTGRILLCFLLLSAGMFNSCSAFLPSTFCMYMTLISMGGWLLENYKVAILATASSAIIGWPFAGVLGVPIAIDILFRRKRLKAFIIWSVISLIVFLVPVVWVDLQYYGKLVIAPLNIVIYNVFTDHGPDLYGVEPLSYYVINGFLNFNVVFLLACCCLPLVILFIILDIPVWLVLLPMYIWIAIFFTRPHKEERFLFPIYPLFALSGAVAVDYIQNPNLFIKIVFSKV